MQASDIQRPEQKELVQNEQINNIDSLKDCRINHFKLILLIQMSKITISMMMS
jgi:hypothetical protein